MQKKRNSPPVKGGLISESFSLWLHPPKNVPNHYSEHLLFIRKYSEWKNSDLANFFKNEKPSEIKPPLLHIEYVYA